MEEPRRCARLLLATTTGMLGVAVGFLPLLATRLGLPPLVGAATVAALALTSTILQPVVGRARDDGRIGTRAGSTAAFAVAALALLALGLLPHAATLSIAAVAIGAMVGTVTPLAFAHLAASTPHERMGRTMGNAELGREVGDAGGPLLVGAVATGAGLPVALAALAVVVAASGVTGWFGLGRARPRGR